MPHDKVFENNYVLDSIMRTHKIKKKDLYFASLDISNAFGTLRTGQFLGAFKATAAGEDFIDTVKNI